MLTFSLLFKISPIPQERERSEHQLLFPLQNSWILTDLGQGHLYIVDATQSLDLLKHLGDSHPLKAKYLKEKKSIIVFLDTGTLHPLMTSKLIVGRLSALETHLRKNTTRNGRGNTTSGMRSTKRYAVGVQHRPSANRGLFSRETFTYLLLSEIPPSQEATEKTMLLDKVRAIAIQVATMQKSFQEETIAIQKITQNQQRTSVGMFTGNSKGNNAMLDIRGRRGPQAGVCSIPQSV